MAGWTPAPPRGTAPRRNDRVAAQAMLLHEGARAYALLAAHMPVVVVKGAATAPLLWADGERAITDVDLLVPWRRLADARAQFAHDGNGWTLIEARHRPLGVRLHRAFTVRSARGMLVDVHGAVAQRVRWPHDVDGILARAVPMSMGRHTVRRASDEDLLLIAALNEAKDEHALKSSSIEDIARLARVRPIAWDVVVERARQWRATVATWTALDRACEIHDAPIPPATLRALRPRRARLLRGALDAHLSSRRVRQTIVGPLLTDSPARFAASAAGFLAVRSLDAGAQAVASLRRFIKGAST